MSSASRSTPRAALMLVVLAGLAGLLAACTSGPAGPPAASASAHRGSGEPSATTSPPRPTATSRPPIPTSPSPTALPSSAPAQLTPVSSSPDDLGRVDIRGGTPLRTSVAVRLPPSSGYTVTAGCIGRAGTLLHWSVVGTTGAAKGFLFGSTVPCNGAFTADAAMAGIDSTAPARLEVVLDPGGQAATVVLRTAAADAHL